MYTCIHVHYQAGLQVPIIAGRPGTLRAGLFLVIFLTEHSGHSLHNFKEPGRKTESPVKQAQTRAKVADGWAGAILQYNKTYVQ